MQMTHPDATPGNAPAATAAEDRQLCPLSFAQERLWFLNQLRPGSTAYNISQAWRLTGLLNVSAFEGAVNQVIRRQESLRTTFARVEGKPVEIISAFEPIRLRVSDLSATPNPAAAVETAIQAAAHHAFDLQQGPLFRVDLFRVSDNHHVVLFTLHHIISDAWSFEILRQEITEGYAALCEGRDPVLPELPIQYLDYAHWQRENLSADTLRDEMEFWREYLGGELPRLELPFDKSPCADDTAGASEPFCLDRETTAALRGIAQRESATLFSVLLAGFSMLLHRLSGQNDLIVGTPVSARDLPETTNLIGFLVDTIPLRTRIDGNLTFGEYVRSVRDSAFSAFAHHESPFEEVVKALQPNRAGGENPLFQAVLALHGGFKSEWELGNLCATLQDVATDTAKFDLTFLLEECPGGIKGRVEFKTGRFEAETIKRFLQQFNLLLRAVAANPDHRLRDYELLTNAERQRVLVEWNDTATPYERDLCVHPLFEAQARMTPNAIALQFGGATLTYGQLNARADHFARRLGERGVKAGALVGVAMERSIDFIVTLLAILKAGAAYVPLDRSYPRERLAFMIREAGLRLIVADAAFRDSTQTQPLLLNDTSGELQVLCAEDVVNCASASVESAAPATVPDNVAYVMFTSGSTGNPKAVAIPHRAIVRLVRNTNYASFSATDVFLQLAPVSFDAATLEIWGALLNGARLVISPPHTLSLEELGRCIEESGVTTLWLTAGLFHQMVDYQLPRLRNVRQLLAGGDVLSVPHVLRVLQDLPGCQLINGYGPTENTTFTCCYRIPRGWPGGRSVPIGSPISNTRVYVLDAALRPLPVGGVGELYAAGDGLARGYLNEPTLNDERFIRREIEGRSERLYKTGDRVRWRPDGTLEFLGRSDQQVKIRGYRIEPGEIEAALMRHPDVRQAVVVARPTANQDRQLIAYVTVRDTAASEERQLRDFSAESLPPYMVPARVIVVPALPLTPNGKVDFRRLPSPDDTAHPSMEAASPRDSVEETLCGIWKDLLGRNGFGIHDNFFQLGGHSLLITQMLSRIARVLHQELPVRTVFEFPTVAGLAEKLRQPAAQTTAAAGIAPRRRARSEAQQLLTRIDQLSDSEIESFLSRPQ
ncbi:MAG TPA: amino acid adenylation domain-containing protein [Verrucomicrobiae bacterium]|nr:amino acid adenylation domain-containing protein [Verrucomicrobiae bacterium]